jgi:hypothetical protein
MGMLTGSLVVSYISSVWATWVAMMVLLAAHLGTNYLAVRAVSMRTLNRQRANLAFSAYLSNEKKGFPTPEEISIQEKVFEKDGVLRWKGGKVLGYCVIGVPLQSILDAFNEAKPITESSTDLQSSDATQLLEKFEHDDYIMYYDMPRKTFLIVLKVSATPLTQLHAWMQALFAARKLDLGVPVYSAVHAVKDLTSSIANITPEILEKELVAAGWDIEIGALETKSGTRLLEAEMQEQKAY